MSTSLALIELGKYPKDQYNVLVPTTRFEQISPFHQLRVQEVQLSPDPQTGDAFKVGSQKVGERWEDVLSLSKTGLMKLAQAAGIIWNWVETRPLAVTRDYVLYQAVGAIRMPSGEWIPLKGTKEIDLSVVELEVQEDNLKKAPEIPPERRHGLTPEQWAEQQTAANMIQWRKNKLHRAETGAMLRVVRALLAIPHKFSPAQLQKPFVVPSVVFAPDPTDPEVRRMMLEVGVRAMSQLFGLQTALPGHPLLGPGPVIDADDVGGDPEGLNGGVAPGPVQDDREVGAPAEAPAPPPVAGVGGASAAPPGAPGPGPAPNGGAPGAGGQPAAPAGSGGLFPHGAPRGPATAPDPAKRPAGGRAAGDVVAYCESCGAGIKSDRVVQYSKEHYGGLVLCYKCQLAAKGTGAAGGEPA